MAPSSKTGRDKVRKGHNWGLVAAVSPYLRPKSLLFEVNLSSMQRNADEEVRSRTGKMRLQIQHGFARGIIKNTVSKVCVLKL
jgi:hypothetical protein